ncbi:MAG: metallophosphoesterase [Clostridia bacterium]|nr:metallophosphoesterase [Clostridia bacterium]
MKTAIVFSDTHGNIRALKKLDEIFKETDYIFHLGDYSADFIEIKNKYPQKCFSVPGNCDLRSGDGFIIIDGVKIFYTHGHDYGVKQSLTKLYFKAKEVGANVVLYGHTHMADVTVTDNIKFINPGAMRYGTCTYAYLVIAGGKCYEKIVELF